MSPGLEVVSRAPLPESRFLFALFYIPFENHLSVALLGSPTYTSLMSLKDAVVIV